MDPRDVRGRFLWHELMTPEPNRAAQFYSHVVGWRVEEWEDSDPPYWIFSVDGQPRAGLMELPEEAREQGSPPHWLGYVGVDDADAATAEAVSLGASRLVAPRDIPSVGRIAVIRDPQGAVLALNQPEAGMTEDVAGSGPGSFTWHELPTTDLDGAFEFYSNLFGWEEKSTFDMGEMGPYRIFGLGDTQLGGLFRMPLDRPPPPAWLYYVRVDDVAAAVDRVADRNGRVVSGPMEVPGGDRVAQGSDPQGALFALHEVRHEQAGPA